MEELIKNFGIDWKLLLTQAVNFFILFAILKRFAYQPILRMLAKRREDIRKGVLMTEEARVRLASATEEREKLLAATNRESLEVVARAEHAAEKRKEELLAETSKKTESIVADAKRTIARERTGLEEGVYRSSRILVEEGIKRILGKLPEK